MTGFIYIYCRKLMKLPHLTCHYICKCIRITLHLFLSDLWDRLSKVFPNIWAASAFKGATGACVYATNIMYHIDNHLTWLSVLEREKSKFQNIRGIVVTGWQR